MAAVDRQKSQNYSQFNAELGDPANVSVQNPAGVQVVYTEDTRPRSVRCDAAGAVVVTDVAGNTSTKNVLQSEVLEFRPLTIEDGTTVITHSYW